MDEEAINQFIAVTNSDPESASRYLQFANGDLDSAVTLFFESGGLLPAASHSPTPPEVIDIPEDDEAMARRLAEEWAPQPAEVRAPIAPTRQVLQDTMDGPLPPHYTSSRRPAPLGVFNQAAPSIWNIDHEDEVLREATGGASAESKKASRLARLFQPPFDLMNNVDLDTAKVTAAEQCKWIMINVQDNSDFSSQMLNRDLWKDKDVKSLVKESFYFLQYTHDSVDGQEYAQFYSFQKFPHIGILDPRTGERVKVWDKNIEPIEFISDVTEFLDRYSLDENMKNPIAKAPIPKSKPPAQMSEEEQMQAAIVASLPVQPEHQDSEMEDIPESKFSSIPAISHEEPPVGAPDSTRIQLRLPSGQRLVRRFLLNDKIQRIFEFCKTGVEETRHTSFKIVFNRSMLIDRLDETLGSAGLKNASLVVELDDE